MFQETKFLSLSEGGLKCLMQQLIVVFYLLVAVVEQQAAQGSGGNRNFRNVFTGHLHLSSLNCSLLTTSLQCCLALGPSRTNNFQKVLFLELLWVHSKTEGQCIDYPSISLAPTCRAPSVVSVTHQSGTLVTSDRCTFTH